MKKRLGAALIVAMVSLLSACGTKSAPAPSAETGQKGTGAGAAETAPMVQVTVLLQITGF